MASYPPPNENVAIFNPVNFISGGEGLTLQEGKKFFLQYPDAQGEENLETTNVDGVLTANDQAFFNDKITLEQTTPGEDALNIIVDYPGYAIRATTRTNPTTNTQLTIAPTAVDNQINTIVQLGDALIYSTTGNLTGGSLAITALGAVADFGVRLNAPDDIVEIGGLLELMTNNGIKFSNGTIQTTAYTGDGSETLAEVLAVGNSAGANSINMNNNAITNALSINYTGGTTMTSAYTGGTPGTYTNTTMTIDANGKISAISSGTSTTPINITINASGAPYTLQSGYDSKVSGNNCKQNLAILTWNGFPTSTYSQIIQVDYSLSINVGGGTGNALTFNPRFYDKGSIFINPQYLTSSFNSYTGFPANAILFTNRTQTSQGNAGTNPGTGLVDYYTSFIGQIYIQYTYPSTTLLIYYLNSNADANIQVPVSAPFPYGYYQADNWCGFSATLVNNASYFGDSCNLVASTTQTIYP